MTIYTAIATIPGEAAADSLSAALEALASEPYGVGVFEVEDGSGLWEVAAYFMDPPDETGLALASAAFGASQFAVSAVGDRDWVAEVRRELAPVIAGRFIVHGAHDRAMAAGNRHALEIEAAMAFGTGHHGTTRGCLNAIDRLARIGFRPRRIADIGAGTAVLAMAAASVWRRPAIASDIDPVAVATSEANIRANRFGPDVRALQAVGFRSSVLRAAAPFDLILANILARPLKRLAPDMAWATAPGGVIVLSGILNEQADGVLAVYRSWGFATRWRSRDGEWTTLTLVRSQKRKRAAWG